MDGAKEIFELIDEIVIRATALGSLIFFCLFYIWNHIKDFKNKSLDGDKKVTHKSKKNQKQRVKTKNSVDKKEVAS